MICKYCKRNIVEDAIFCSYCGKKLKSSDGPYNGSIDSKSLAYVQFYTTVKAYFTEISPDRIDIGRYFNPAKKDNMREVFYQVAVDLQDYNMMPSVIGFSRADRLPLFKKILFDFDSNKVMETYTADSLYEEFCANFPVKNRDSKFNLWRKYARSLMEACNYLGRFRSVKELNDYVDGFNGDVGIIYEIKNSIYGTGFALACNLIKDLGFVDYAKPDTHTIDVICAAGLSERDELSVMKAMQNIAKANDDSAFNVDRMIWLICSGNYFLDDFKTKSYKKELISIIS